MIVIIFDYYNYYNINSKICTLIYHYPFSVIDTNPYLNDPKITTTMPIPLIRPTGSPKYNVPNATNKTCLTLAAMQRVRAEVTLFAMNEDTFNENDKMPESRTTCKAGPAASSSHLLIIADTSPVTILMMIIMMIITKTFLHDYDT